MSPSAPSPAAGASPTREALTDAALLAVDALLTAGAALRVTRFATTDVLGGWVLSDPLHRWASRRDPDGPHPFGYLAPPAAWRHRLVSALDCPFCVGTQAALVIGAALAATSSRTAPTTSPRSRPAPSTSRGLLRSQLHRRSALGRALRAAAASLAAAYVVGHVSHWLDTPAQPQPAPAPAPAPVPVPVPTAKDSK